MGRERLAARRKALGFTQESLAQALSVTTSTVAHWEQGTSTPMARHRPGLVERLETTPTGLDVLLDINGEGNGHAMPGWLGRLGEIEQASGSLAVWEPVAVHGLLQTEAYALAVEAADAVAKGGDAISRRVQSRLGRQAALGRQPDPLDLRVILDESVLRRVAGDRAVMADQLDHLAEIAERPNVDLRVLPLDAGRFSAAFGAFSLFAQPGMPAPWMAVTEDRAGPHYHDADHHPEAVQAHVDVFNHLAGHSLSPADSIDLILSVSKEHR